MTRSSPYIYIKLKKSTMLSITRRVCIRKMSAKPSKVQENNLGELLTRYIYATIADNDRSSERLNKFNPLAHQTYANIIRKKDDPQKMDGVEGRFMIATEPKQHLALFLRKVGEELEGAVTGGNRVVLEDADDATIIASKLNDVYDGDSHVGNFINIGTALSTKFGVTLKSAVDETMWLQAQIIGLLPRYKTRLHVIANVTGAIDTSLKACAWVIGRLVWFGAETKITSELLVSTLSLYGYPLTPLDEVVHDIREKVVRPKKPTKTSTVKKIIESMTTEVKPEQLNTALANAVSNGVLAEVSSANTQPNSEKVANVIDVAAVLNAL